LHYTDFSHHLTWETTQTLGVFHPLSNTYGQKKCEPTNKQVYFKEIDTYTHTYTNTHVYTHPLD